MRQKFFIKSSCQGNKLFLFEIVCFKTTTESLGNISEFGRLWAYSIKQVIWPAEKVARYSSNVDYFGMLYAALLQTDLYSLVKPGHCFKIFQKMYIWIYGVYKKYKKYLYYIFVFMKKCWLIVANSKNRYHCHSWAGNITSLLL